MVGYATRLFARILTSKVWRAHNKSFFIIAKPMKGDLTLRTTQTFNCSSAIDASQTLSWCWIESCTAWSNVYTWSILKKHIGRTLLYINALTHLYLIIWSITGHTKPEVVNFQAIGWPLYTYPLYTDFIFFTLSILKSAFSCIIQIPPSYALLTIIGQQIVKIAILCIVSAWPKSKLLSFLAAH